MRIANDKRKRDNRIYEIPVNGKYDTRNTTNSARELNKKNKARRRFYSTLLMLVLCTFLVIGGLCAASIFTGVLDGKPFEKFVSADDNGKSKNPNIVIDIIKDKVMPSVKEEAIEEQEEEVHEITPIGARVWPLKELNFYNDVPASSNEKSDIKVKKGTRLVVDNLEGDYFKVEYDGETGYIDARYCLINLPDYVGDLLEYNITNSYSSIFMAHDYKLYGITETVLPGYEDVMVSEGEYLVPYLYPCANKLIPVAQKVYDDGYKLKIYDAYRPYETTRFLYDTVYSYLTKHVPNRDENGNEIVEYDDEGNVLLTDSITYPPVGSVVAYDGSLMLNDFVTVLAPAGTITQYPVGSMVIEDGAVIDSENNVLGRLAFDNENNLISLDYVETGETVEEIDSVATPSSEENVITDTYSNVITGGRHNLGAFLASKSSAHNKGIALDLTLCDRETKEDLPMQTAMHDLSYHSVIASNNDNANLLAKYMTEGGFNDLSSEWWHFQDDETRNQLGIQFLLEKGVSP